MMQLNMKNQPGFTLLISALISSIALALGASIFQLAQKEITLSSIGRDSQFAFYAADTGAECAMYWDARFHFPTTTLTTATVNCDNQNMETSVARDGSAIISSFRFAPNGYCVNVSVSKSPYRGSFETMIRADGFSTSCETRANSPRVLQRSVELRG